MLIQGEFMSMENNKTKEDTFLDWLGMKSGLNLRYLLRNGNWVSLRFLIVSLTGFLLSYFFAKFGTKELLGQYQIILSILSIVSVVSFLGLNSSAMEAVVQGRDASVLRTARLIFRFSWVGVPILIILGGYYIFFQKQVLLGETLIFSSLLFPFLYAASPWSVYYEGKQLFKESSLRVIILNILLTTSLMAGIMGGLDVFWLIGIYLVLNVLVQGKYLYAIAQSIRDKTNDFIDTKFGILVSFQKFASGLSSTLTPLVVSFFFGVESLAIYFIAYYAISALSSFLNNIFALYFPILFKKVSLNHRSNLINNLFAGMVSWAFFVVFLRFLFIPIYGEEYRESLELAYYISFLLFLIPYHVYLVGFFSTQRKNSLLTAVFLLANVFGISSLFITSQLGYLTGVATYLYTLEIVTTLPLLLYYLRLNQSKRI